MSDALAGWLLRGASLAPVARQRLSILVYHRVLATPDPMRPGEMDAAGFDWQMQLIARHCNVLDLAEAVERLRRSSLPPLSVCITFDDGYADNVTIAMPILRRYGLTATFFVATGFLDGGRMWNDTIIEGLRGVRCESLDLDAIGLGRFRIRTPAERAKTALAVIRAVRHLPPVERSARVARLAEQMDAALPDDLMMTSYMISELRASGMMIGAHTVNHPILASIDDATALREVRDSKVRLEDLAGEPVCAFAYPNGKPGMDYHLGHVRIVRQAGFRLAVSTSWGAAGPASDVYQLPRFLPWDGSPARFAGRMIQNWSRRPALAA